MTSNLNDVLDTAAGKAQKAQGESLSTFLASLTTSGIVFGVGVTAYILLKFKLPEYYHQRAHGISNSRGALTSLTTHSLFSSLPEPKSMRPVGLDNYFFDRYLHTLVKTFLLLGMVALPILIPLNVVDGKNESGGVKGLDRLSFSNVGLQHTDRYWAHLSVALFVIITVCHTIRAELQDYARILRDVGGSDSNLLGDSTLLVIENSKQPLTVKSIRRHFHRLAGGILTIRMNRDYSSLRAKIYQRDASIRRLETAETSLIKKANGRSKPHQRKFDAWSGDSDHLIWKKYLDQEDRQSIRLPLFPWLPALPFIGPRADTIYHSRTEVARYNLEIEWDQQHPAKFPPTNSACVYFNQRVPQLVALALKARIPPSWTLKRGTALQDTIWQNLSISWWQELVRTIAVYLLTATLILGFAFPVAFIGSLSQINYLTNTVPGLRWIGSLPGWLVAAMQGVLPPILLSLLTAVVPTALRLLADLQGLHSRQAVENNVQIYYFTFQFIQIFLTVSLSAGITTIIGELSDSIEAVPAVLAQNLPKACNYFFSYIMIYTFSVTMSTLVQFGDLINLFIFSPLLDKTARQKWSRMESLGLQKWGTFLPALTNIACIGLIYSVIAPLIIIFSIICFGAFWLLYRLYPPKLTEAGLFSRALFYPTAIRQLFTGVYFMEICLTGLFFLVRDKEGKACCTGQAAITIVSLVLTAIFQVALDYNQGTFWLSSWSLFQREELSAEEPRKLQSDRAYDEALQSSRPVLWIPSDELGIGDDEIYQTRKSNRDLWISNEGASIDERGKLVLCGTPPVKSM